MYQIDNGKFGEFVMRLRKDKGLTQKELGNALFVSDKTVSKWERGLSMPNVSLLIPIADILGVTVTELLKGERMEKEDKLNINEVENLVTNSVNLALQEQREKHGVKTKWKIWYVVLLFTVFIEFVLFAYFYGLPEEEIILTEGLILLFGGWWCLMAKEELPVYYDENKISVVADGIFRMNLPGLHFNNSNWPHILTAGRIWSMAGGFLYPAVCFFLLFFGMFEDWILTVSLFAALGMFLPVFIAGKKFNCG